MNIGLGQIMAHTPTIVKRVRDGVIVLIGGALVATSVMAPMLHMTGEAFATWCGFAVIGVKALSTMFGVTDEEALAKLQDKVNSKNTTQGDH